MSDDFLSRCAELIAAVPHAADCNGLVGGYESPSCDCDRDGRIARGMVAALAVYADPASLGTTWEFCELAWLVAFEKAAIA